MAIANATSLDVIEMDAASNNSVDDIRELRERVGFAPGGGPAQGLHPRRGAHALLAGVERVPEDARGAAPRARSSCWRRPRRRRCCRPSSTAATASTSCGRASSRSPACCADRRRAEGIELPEAGGRAHRARRDGQLPRRARDAGAARHLQRRERSSSTTSSPCSAWSTRSFCSARSTRSRRGRPPRRCGRSRGSTSRARRGPAAARPGSPRARAARGAGRSARSRSELRVTADRDERLLAQAARLTATR